LLKYGFLLLPINSTLLAKSRPRPLALYFFGNSPAERQHVAVRTTSGAMSHVFVDPLPFGGVGASSMGHYHGE
jgi:coniferyl-aldehyde dehydrogenase